MKKFIILAIMLHLFFVSLIATEYIIGIPVSEIHEVISISDLNSFVRTLSNNGFDVLYYDSSYVIAVEPENPELIFDQKIRLTDYPSKTNLYLISNIPTQSKETLRQAGRILVEMSSGFLLESSLSGLELRAMINNPFTLLSMEPICLQENGSLVSLPKEYRTDIAQLVSYVSVDSVLFRLQQLENFQTRYALADNRLLVAQWIQEKFQSFGIANVQLQEFTYEGTTQYNVVATIPGVECPDEYIIIGGHHDSISNNSDPYFIAPGADDNASGAVAALEMARVIKQYGYQPPVSIRFVTFACEEFGLWGSKHYSQDACDNDQNIRLMINHDMIANNSALADRPVKVMPYDGALDYAAYAMQLTEQYTSLEPYYGNYNSGGTDSYPFWAQGFNVLFFNESEFSPVYHSSNDVVASLDPDYCAEVIKASLACAAYFADIPGSLAAPQAPTVTDVTTSGFTLSWNPVEHATSYELDVYTHNPAGPAADMFFSEYLEGSANNKAIEIFNGTGSSVDLNDYTVHTYIGAASNPTYSLQLTGALANEDVYVIAHTGANAAIQAISDVRSNVAWFDGDDQLALLRESTNSYVDIFGRIGEDPGLYWGEYPVVTANKTLVRKNHITGGVIFNPPSGFPSLATEWESYTLNSTAYLGQHSIFETHYVNGYHGDNIGNVTSYHVSGLDPETTYYCVIRATNDYFTSLNSNEISIQTEEEQTLPMELASFSAMVTAESTIALSWITNTETGMAGYYVYRGDSDQLSNSQLISPMILATNTSQQQAYVFEDIDLYGFGMYYYWLQCLEINGGSDYFGPISIDYSATDDIQIPGLSSHTEISSIYPNPFNSLVFISYGLAEKEYVSFRIYNTRGQLVREFVLGNKENGHYRTEWNGEDKFGNICKTGVYFVRMKAGNCNSWKKITLMK